MANDTLINLLAWCKRERERLQMQREMLQSGRFRIFEKDDSDQQRDISNQHIEQIAANISELDRIIMADYEARIFMQQMLTETEKLEIIEHEWAKARAKNPEVIMRVHVQDETDESGKPRVNVVIAFSGTWASIKKCPRKNSSNSKAL